MPPGPRLQRLNAALHREPVATLAHAAVWSLLIAAGAPLAFLGLLLRAGLRLVRLWRVKRGQEEKEDTAFASEVARAVFITGCDTGFGREIAFVAAAQGFVVFAGCLSKDSFEQFRGVDGVRPLLVDVTRDEQVNEAVATVVAWVAGETADGTDGPRPQQPKRVLHAVVNNAGVGSIGIIDWMDLAAFQQTMEVNYLGTVRVCKAFLPLLKQQAIQSVHTSARIVNLVSMAGLVPGGCGSGAYGPSKFAAAAFSSVLRLELRSFKIQVCTVLPSFHGTPLVTGIGDGTSQIWDALDPEIRAQYGEAYLDGFRRVACDPPQALSWDVAPVIDAVVANLEARHVEPEVLVGADARLGMAVLRLLPGWLVDGLLALVPLPVPAAMVAPQAAAAAAAAAK